MSKSSRVSHCFSHLWLSGRFASVAVPLGSQEAAMFLALFRTYGSMVTFASVTENRSHRWTSVKQIQCYYFIRFLFLSLTLPSGILIRLIPLIPLDSMSLPPILSLFFIGYSVTFTHSAFCHSNLPDIPLTPLDSTSLRILLSSQ